MNPENNGVSNCTVSFGMALVAASLLNALLVVAKEKIPAVQAALQRLTGHHWISHVVIVLGVFGLLGGILSRLNGKIAINHLIKTIVAGVAMSGIIIVAFYLIAD